MVETVAMLEARLRLIDKIRGVERDLAREAYTKQAQQLLRGRSHDLGNTIQIVKLASIEIERRATPEIVELARDLRIAADQAANVLGDLLAAARPEERMQPGAAIAPILRAAVEQARLAIAPPVEVSLEIADAARARLTAVELEAAMIAALLDAAGAGKVHISVRERAIQGKPWVEVIRLDDRTRVDDAEIERAFEPFTLLHVARSVVERAGGEVSLAPGRTGLELAIALPIAG